MIKIGLCGTHGSGKTTKAKELLCAYVAAGKRVYVVQEVARSCPHPLGTSEAQEWIWAEQMHCELSAMALDVDITICDRTAMDNLMYYFYVIEQMDVIPLGLGGPWWDHWNDVYWQAVDWMASYAHIIRLPLNLEWLQAEDPIRPKDVAYARHIDALFDRFVQPYVTGDCDSLPL